MGELRERFWELPLDALGREEWEALCDGCGPCRLLDHKTARCTDYRHRKAFVPDCLRLTPKLIKDVPWLPATCAYRRRAEGKPLPDWHYLLTGSSEAMIRAGACVAGRVVSETDAGPLEHHIIEWGKETLRR